MNLLATLKLVIQVLSLFAARTETKVDDKALEGLQALEKSPALLAWIEGLLPKEGEFTTLDVSALSEDQIAEGQRLAAAAGIDWSQLITILLPILLDCWRKRREAQQ